MPNERRPFTVSTRIPNMRCIGGRLSSRWLGALVLIGGLGGCGEVRPVEPFEEPITDPTQLYTRLTVDKAVINLSTAPGYDTVQLSVTPRDVSGNPMSGLPAPTFSVSDTTKVHVSPTGLVTAFGVTDSVVVRASLTAGAVTRRDSAIINVKNLPTPPKLGSVSIHPIAPDSAVWSILENGNATSAVFARIGGLLSLLQFLDPPVLGYARSSNDVNHPLVARVTDTAGIAINGLKVEYRSLDSSIATIGRTSGIVALQYPGSVRVVAQTLAYNVVKADTMTFTVTTPGSMTVAAQLGVDNAPTFAPREFRIAPYGFVGWANTLSDSVDVIFDDPANVLAPPGDLCGGVDRVFVELFGFPSGNYCGTGNALLAPPSPDFGGFASTLTIQLRQFPVPGVYPYHSVRTGATGRVIVTNDPLAF